MTRKCLSGRALALAVKGGYDGAMKIGIGQDPAKAARDAVRQAKKAVPRPSLALVFASVYARVKKKWPCLARKRLIVKGKKKAVTAYELS